MRLIYVDNHFLCNHCFSEMEEKALPSSKVLLHKYILFTFQVPLSNDCPLFHILSIHSTIENPCFLATANTGVRYIPKWKNPEPLAPGSQNRGARQKQVATEPLGSEPPTRNTCKLRERPGRWKTLSDQELFSQFNQLLLSTWGSHLKSSSTPTESFLIDKTWNPNHYKHKDPKTQYINNLVADFVKAAGLSCIFTAYLKDNKIDSIFLRMSPQRMRHPETTPVWPGEMCLKSTNGRNRLLIYMPTCEQRQHYLFVLTRAFATAI